jgi:hypothetical protein
MWSLWTTGAHCGANSRNILHVLTVNEDGTVAESVSPIVFQEPNDTRCGCRTSELTGVRPAQNRSGPHLGIGEFELAATLLNMAELRLNGRVSKRFGEQC